MTKELWLLRHAKSDWSMPLSDHDRPLNNRGNRQSLLMGNWVQENLTTPDCIISSDSARTEETLMQLLRHIDFDNDKIIWDKALYHASHRTLLAVAQKQLQSYDKVMLVAHNPGLDSLLEYLCPANELEYTAAGKLMTTATLARIRLAGSITEIQSQSGQLLELIRPDDLEQA